MVWMFVSTNIFLYIYFFRFLLHFSMTTKGQAQGSVQKDNNIQYRNQTKNSIIKTEGAQGWRILTRKRFTSPSTDPRGPELWKNYGPKVPIRSRGRGILPLPPSLLALCLPSEDGVFFYPFHPQQGSFCLLTARLQPLCLQSHLVWLLSWWTAGENAVGARGAVGRGQKEFLSSPPPLQPPQPLSILLTKGSAWSHSQWAVCMAYMHTTSSLQIQ